MKDWLAKLVGKGLGRPRLVGPARRVIGPKPTKVIEVPARFAWDEKRWQRKDKADHVEFAGRYRVYDFTARTWREFNGFVRQQGNDIAAYIADPPQEMKRHAHGSCLQLANAPWFRLHWNRHPATVDDALLYMERMLDESFNGTRKA
ncbi:MAG: hypothetical protein WC829_00810 [Hyphomicrobium sp.]|jgi:hypothetical protein